MRVVNCEGRLGVEIDGRVVDVAQRSQGRLPEDPMEAFGVWSELLDWASSHSADDSDPQTDPTRLGPPVPVPAQVFAIGLNYRDHAEEAGLPIAFGPLGPALVSLEEFEDPDALALRCWVDGELMQESSTSNLIFSVPELIEAISRYCVLQPGDLIFTGTPAGVGSVREPRRYLKSGETIRSEIEGIGELSNRCVDGQ